MSTTPEERTQSLATLLNYVWTDWQASFIASAIRQAEDIRALKSKEP
jgi:hypothetical protein